MSVGQGRLIEKRIWQKILQDLADQINIERDRNTEGYYENWDDDQQQSIEELLKNQQS